MAHALPSAIHTLALIAGAAVAAVSCGGGQGRAGSGTGGAGGAEGSTATSTSSSASTSSSTSSGMPTGPHLVVPAVIDIPYAVAGQGGATAEVQVSNDGDAPLDGLVWALSGDPSISLGAAPSSLAAGETVTLSVAWSGSTTEAIVQSTLKVTMPKGTTGVPVFAVAGDPGLGAAAWEDVTGAGGVLAGTGVTVAMPTAPFPDGSASYTDPSVRVFLPEGYRDRGAHDLVVHFHGFSTTVASTIATHLYQQHVYASGSNAVLVVPQGPVNAASGDFGKLMAKGGLSRMLTEVLVLLYREGKITHPLPGELVITSHSGGYQAVAAALDPANLAPKIGQVDLFDSIYGYESTFEGFALGGGVLRSNYSLSAGTLANNQTVAADLAQKGLPPATAATQRALRDVPPVIDFASTTHDGTTRLDGAYGEALRWKLPHSRRGPRIELREVVATGAMATARWLAPADDDLTGFLVESSADGVTWSTAAMAPPSASDASFALAKGARVRVRAVMTGVAPADVLASDTYRVDPAAKVLVVDGFDRVLDGAFGGLQHDFAALVGEAVGPVASISHRAVTEDGFDLTAWPTVVWLLGDESTGDESVSAAEQTALTAYADGGGHLLMSGSDVGYDIGQTPSGATFLAHCFGASYAADDSGSLSLTGHGPLASLAPFAVGGAGAPYPAPTLDVLSVTQGGAVVLQYGNGKVAAVGLAGKAALVGFPVELTGSSQMAAVMKALLGFIGAP